MNICGKLDSDLNARQHVVDGIQTRVVNCKRNDNILLDDSLCIKLVGTKPTTQITCNTQSCNPCELSSTVLEYSRPFNDDVNQGKGGTTTWTFNCSEQGNYNVMLCLYVQAPDGGKSGISKCAHFIGVCVNAIRGISGDCTTNNGDGMMNLPVNRIDLLTAGSITIVNEAPYTAFVSLNLGNHYLNAGENYFSITTNTQTDTSTGVYGVFTSQVNHGIKINKV